MNKISLMVVISTMLMSCNNKDPQELINAAISAHGGDLFNSKAVSFDFRNKHYTISKDNSNYTYTREFEDDSLGQIKDVLVNSSGFKRYINDTLVNTTEEWKIKYASSVNSVLYFIQLPNGLNDPAVNKKYLGQDIISNRLYEKVQVTFNEENGGEDFEDVFVYWINAKTHIMDFMAYSYKTDGGGIRFRQAINQRKIKGILFQDYVNFKPSTDTKVQDLDKSFEAASLIELSQIINENIEVR